MLLRADLHRAYDKRRFTFLPKKPSTLVTHVFESESLRDIYHIVELNVTYNAPEYHFARFAWTILPLVKDFLLRYRWRLLLVQGEAQMASPDECLDYANPPKEKSESVSPRKFSSPKKGGSRRGSPTKPRSPSKRSHQEMETEMEAVVLDDRPESQADQGSRQTSPKRARQTGIAPFDTGTAPVFNPTQHGPSALQDGGGEAQWPQDTDSLPLAPSHSLPALPAHYHNEHESSPEEESSQAETWNSSPPSTEHEHHQWMPWRKLRAMATSHLDKERARADTKHWEKEQAWYDGILRNGGGLDSSLIERYRYSRGDDDADYCQIPLED